MLLSAPDIAVSTYTRTKSRSPLYFAAKHNFFSVVKLLVEKGNVYYVIINFHNFLKNSALILFLFSSSSNALLNYFFFSFFNIFCIIIIAITLCIKKRLILLFFISCKTQALMRQKVYTLRLNADTQQSCSIFSR